jgi:hypothetical protein
MASYRALQNFVTDSGGDAGEIGLSGTLTETSMRRVFAAMNLDASSRFFDAGCGNALPCVVAAREHGSVCQGVDFDATKVFKAREVVRMAGLTASVTVRHLDFKDMVPADLATVTHLFSFWEGIPDADIRRLAALPMPACRCIATVQRSMGNTAVEQMHELGFSRPLELLDTIAVSQSGSRAKYRAYVFSVDTA